MKINRYLRREKMRIEDLIGLEVVSSDARIIGNVEGVGIDAENWRVPALKVGLRKGIEEILELKKPLFGSVTTYLNTEGIDSISDIVALKVPLEELRSVIMETDTELPTAGNIVGTRVVAKGGKHIGFVENFIILPENDWSIKHMVVKLEKSVVDKLGLRKSLMGTPSIKILTQDIKTIGDMVMLRVTVDELKEFLGKKSRRVETEEPEEPQPEEEKRVARKETPPAPAPLKDFQMDIGDEPGERL